MYWPETRVNVLEEAVNKLKERGVESIGLEGSVQSPKINFQKYSLFFFKSTKRDVRNFDKCEGVVKQAIEKYGKIDILVNCAAGNFLCLAEDLSANAFKTVIEIDTIGTFNMSKASFGALAESKGLVINITATLQYPMTWYQTHASAAKAAVDSLTRSLAVEWGDHSIRVVGIAPGPIANTEGSSPFCFYTFKNAQFAPKKRNVKARKGTERGTARKNSNEEDGNDWYTLNFFFPTFHL